LAVLESVTESGASRRRLRLASPAHLGALGEIDLANEADVALALEAARKAQPEWASAGFRARQRVLERALKILVERQDEFLDVIVSETGKPREEALVSEILAACDALQFYAKRAGRILADRTLPLHLMKTKKLRISYRPLGVVGIITPWNFPFLLALNPTVQALMAGNAVLLKPSEATPLSGQLVEQLLRAAGLPEGVFQLLLGDGETGAALVNAGVDKISFTGSVASGRRVAEACARQLIPCTLELGGKDPMIVCRDADLERAAAGAVYGAFANAGQICVSTERVYVVDEVADEFTRKVLEKTAALRQGPNGESDVGAINHANQLGVI
jgi:succinate-semialdehyde dehydrogenase/glutarate-semialdehyde dehydrogenase